MNKCLVKLNTMINPSSKGIGNFKGEGNNSKWLPGYVCIPNTPALTTVTLLCLYFSPVMEINPLLELLTCY